jgi:hypothetical protein
VLVALQLLSFIERITKELFSQFDFLSYLPTNSFLLVCFLLQNTQLIACKCKIKPPWESKV